MPRLSNEVQTHVRKARECALLAVEVYNKPGVSFRSGGYIVLMCIAWTALFHAIAFKQHKKPFYRMRNKRNFLRVDGDYKAWELKHCLGDFFGEVSSPVRRNLEFFVGLRNRIEHRSMPSLDATLFGECQSLLFNFEEVLTKHFGNSFALNESLTMALQFSMLRDSAQAAAIAKLRSPLTRSVDQYIKTFRSSLTTEERDDLKYSFKVFLVPKLANHQGKADVAVEFVKFDSSKPDQMDHYERLVALIKPSVTAVANPGGLKPGDVCKSVEPVVKQHVGKGYKFSASYHHAKACLFYRIRPKRGSADKGKTNAKFCHFDEAHQDYVYTTAWRDHLIAEMKKRGQYQKMLGI